MTFSKNNYFAIIPARGGSTGIKNKNLLKIKGKTLVSIAANFITKFNFFKQIILSSDSSKILNSVKNRKITKDKRPKKLSSKFSKTVDTINYLAKKYKFMNNDIIFIFEPTSPLRNKKDVLKAKKIIDQKFQQSVCSFTESWVHPLKVWKLDNSKMKFYLNNKNTLLPRQKHYRTFKATGHVIAFKYKKNLKEIIDNNSSFILIDKLRGLDIDDIIDYNFVKFIYEKKK